MTAKQSFHGTSVHLDLRELGAADFGFKVWDSGSLVFGGCSVSDGGFLVKGVVFSGVKLWI